MSSVTRDGIVLAVSSAKSERFSVLEIAELMGVGVNTAKSHFARAAFRPTDTESRGRRVYDQGTLKRYALWLYMAPGTDGPISYAAHKREDILDKVNIEELWAALERSVEEFVSHLLGERQA